MTKAEPTPTTVFDPPRRLPRSGEGTPQFEAAYVELLGMTHTDVLVYTMKKALWLTRGSKHDAEDLAQEAHIRILRASFDRPANGRAYISSILARLHIDRGRRKTTQVKYLGTRTGFEIALDEGVRDRTADDVADTATGSAFSREVRHRITTFGDSLTSEDMHALLHAWIDLENGELRSGKDIESLTGFSESKVKRLRADLGRLLKDALAGLKNPDQTA